MPTLLHIDSSLGTKESSVSKQLSAAFQEEWLAQNPDGTVIYRDLAADPIPHLTAADHAAGDKAPLRAKLAEEMEQADLILIGTPMHNFTIPSTLKAWIDQACITGRTGSAEGTVAGTPTVVINARGGGYSPGTPNEDKEFATSYLNKVLSGMFGIEAEFIVSELTLADFVPQMEHLRDLAADNHTKAQQQVVERARALASANA
ncbi:FMN-dependent NADH-azoreductase [Corynebacterium lubricantis]|uniref:FMN-dependent NADH-azoreductase n=1 Tax=Corynebacterium lubricantis TaxID=541095 RepID=UPI000361CBB5|nr:NAD(P)H-dependent oxidoreductase [Corynebacterium lubricantis]